MALALVEGEGGAVSPAAICESVSEGKAYSSGGRREYPLPLLCDPPSVGCCHTLALLLLMLPREWGEVLRRA